MGGFVRQIIRQEGPKRAFEAQKEARKVEPKGPTRAEMEQDQRRGIKRRGRRATILTSTKGVDEDLTLGTRTLLG